MIGPRAAQQDLQFIFHGGQWYYQLILIHFYLKLHYACRLRAIEVCIVEIHGLFSSDDDSREEQQRCASSWGWPEECRFRDPVHPVAGSSWLAGVRDFVLLCRCCVVTYVSGPDHKAGLHFSIRAQVGYIPAWFGLCWCRNIRG